MRARGPRTQTRATAQVNDVYGTSGWLADYARQQSGVRSPHVQYGPEARVPGPRCRVGQ